MTTHQTIKAPGRCFFVGDIHGHIDELTATLDAQAFNPADGDILIAVGDLIDRGPHSIAVLELLSEPWFFSVLGNHEQMALDALPHVLARPADLTIDAATALKMWLYHGGAWIDDELDKFDAAADPSAGKIGLVDSIRNRLRQLPWTITVEYQNKFRIGVVHADCPVQGWEALPERMRDKKVMTSALYGRTKVDAVVRDGASPGTTIGGIDAVVCGHTVTPDGPVSHGNMIWIETGVFCTGVLTVLEASEVMRLVGYGQSR
ncbi:metallophosphoesterase [Allohahella marinimesophila]|uniref:Metallophosphoesterase n=1 Tax=Allohahella marinimesophila TaxID=1054972 RepID=A0ABP7Q6V9_9GAMM